MPLLWGSGFILMKGPREQITREQREPDDGWLKRQPDNMVCPLQRGWMRAAQCVDSVLDVCGEDANCVESQAHSGVSTKPWDAKTHRASEFADAR